MEKILKILIDYRKKSAINALFKNINNLSIICFAIFLFIILFEHIFYIDSSIRKSISLIFINLIIISLSYLVIKFIIHFYSLFSYKNFYDIAIEIGKKNKQIKDQLGIVLHTKNIEFINEYFQCNNKEIFKNILLEKFNQIFDKNPYINKLID